MKARGSMLNKYILGTGIAGLIYAFYNKDYIAIGDSHGGQMASHFPLGTRFLHMNEYSEKFLKDLSLPIIPIKIKTGYQTRKGHYVDLMLDRGYKEKYYMKSRGLKTLEGYDDTAMSEGKNCFIALKVDFEEVIKRLCLVLDKRLIKDKVAEIDTQRKTIALASGTIFEYESFVNTMSLNIFAGLLKNAIFPGADNFKCFPITYIWLKPQTKSDFDYVYVAQSNIPHHRLTWDDNGVCAEWFGAHKPEECKKIYKDKYVDSQILWNAQIIPFKEDLKLEAVKFIGRYGRWDRHYKTERVIEEAMKNEKNGT